MIAAWRIRQAGTWRSPGGVELLREHARALAAADDQADRVAAAGRVLDCYLYTALAAGRHFAPRASAYRRPPPGNPSAQAPDLSTLGQSAAWLEAERANLHAAADDAATRGHSRHAVAIPAAIGGFLAARGHWDQSAALHQSALAAARQAGDRLGEADALSTLGVLQRENGSYLAAAASLARALALYRDIDDHRGQADALNELGFLRVLTGDYPAATASHQQALALFGDLGHRLGQAEALNRLGELSLRTSATAQARDQHRRALAIARDISAAPEEARALEGIGNSHRQEGGPSQAVAPLRQALTIYQRIGAPGAKRVQETLHSGPVSWA
jgi:tetratricopeptide (TPR) repeat protein